MWNDIDDYAESINKKLFYSQNGILRMSVCEFFLLPF